MGAHVALARCVQCPSHLLPYIHAGVARDAALVGLSQVFAAPSQPIDKPSATGCIRKVPILHMPDHRYCEAAAA
jgi:hypothetical protein